MAEKKALSRRDFISRGAKTAAGVAAASTVVHSFIPGKVLGANDRINIAVLGIHGRGKSHYREWTKIPGVHVKTLCDPDERLFPDRVAEVEKLQGKKPGTEVDLRRVFDDKDIDAVSIATVDHWHALATIWACQAGKHVYVEKPVWFRWVCRIVVFGACARLLNSCIPASWATFTWPRACALNHGIR